MSTVTKAPSGVSKPYPDISHVRDRIEHLHLNCAHSPGLVNPVPTEDGGLRYQWESVYTPLALIAQIYDDVNGRYALRVFSTFDEELTENESFDLGTMLSNRPVQEWLDDCGTVFAAFAEVSR